MDMWKNEDYVDYYVFTRCYTYTCTSTTIFIHQGRSLGWILDRIRCVSYFFYACTRLIAKLLTPFFQYIGSRLAYEYMAR